MKLFIFLGLLVFLTPFSYAQQASTGSSTDNSLDPASAEALGKTQALLTDPKQRDGAINKSLNAKRADDFVKQLAGGKEVNAEIYKLASDVFADIVLKDKGDVVKMQEDMAKFQKNPEAFASDWTPEQKAKLKELAEKLGVSIKPQ